MDVFGKRKAGDQTEVLIGVEPKSWVGEKGKRKAKARLKKIMVAKETKKEAQRFVDETIEKDSMVNTDGSPGSNLLRVEFPAACGVEYSRERVYS